MSVTKLPKSVREVPFSLNKVPKSDADLVKSDIFLIKSDVSLVKSGSDLVKKIISLVKSRFDLGLLSSDLVIWAGGGSASYWSGGGSGGAVRLLASRITGIGSIDVSGGSGVSDSGGGVHAGSGRIRFDTYDNEFSGGINGQFTSGSQFIIIPTSGQLPQLTVTSVGGVPVSASPTGILSTPDAVLSAQQNNPIPIVVNCSNIPLNTQITVSVKPANGSPVSATGLNSTGTMSSSTATISIVIPRGGGLIYATAATSN